MQHRIPRRLAVAAVTVLCLVAGTAQAEAFTSAGKKFINQGNGLALGLYDNRPAASGEYVVLNPYESRLTQKWYVIAKPNGYFQLCSGANSSLCVTYANGPLQLGPCGGQAWDATWLWLRPEPAGGYSIRPVYDYWPFGDLYANQAITEDGPRPPTPWYRFAIVDLPSTAPPPSDDPFPPVCQTKPSLPQCG